MNLTNINLTNFFVNVTQLGAEWVLWLLVVLSMVSLTVMLERSIYFLRRTCSFDWLMARLESLLRAGEVQEALELTKGMRAPEAVVARAGLLQFKKSADVVSETMLSAKARERVQMESYLTILATLGNNVPFVGLLGTVLGIIKASGDLAAAQASKEAGSGAVMAGVFEALVATAVGLFVAIPAVVAYNYFQRSVRTRMGHVDSLAHMILAQHAHHKTHLRGNPAPQLAAEPVESKTVIVSSVAEAK